MIDLNKSLEVFDPNRYLPNKHAIFIIGCGAVGSHIATLLARLGCPKLILVDDDRVSSHNIANQNFVFNDIGRYKAEVVAETCRAINPDIDVAAKITRWDSSKQLHHAYVFMCVDSIEPRKEMCRYARVMPGAVEIIMDVRMGLFNHQVYTVTPDRFKDYQNTMNFTDEEADAQTKKSACNFELSVCYTVWEATGICVDRFIRVLLGQKPSLTTLVEPTAILDL